MSCPYCQSHESCVHHLLSVDFDERRACGGELYGLFNRRIERMLSQSRDTEEEVQESAVLEACIAEVEELIASSGKEVGGELASGVFEDFFCPSPAIVDKVVKEYEHRFFRPDGK